MREQAKPMRAKGTHQEREWELDFYAFEGQAGKGLPFWLPRAAHVRAIIEHYWRQEHLKAGYQLVYTPHIGRRELWDTSEHTVYFADRMYGAFSPRLSESIQGDEFADEEQEAADQYLLRPMNCPFHILLYGSQPRHAKDLPVRYAELGTVYRYVPEGSLDGLLCVRGFTQDDAHIFCTESQLKEEVIGVLRFARSMLEEFGFTADDSRIQLCTEPKGHTLSGEDWRWAQSILTDAFNELYSFERLHTEPARSLFYGPKLDIVIQDARGKSWGCSTIQIDLLLPKRFDLAYWDGNEKKRPIIVHRTLLGSLERFCDLLMQRFEGALPVWLSPIQATVLPVSERKNRAYAMIVHRQLLDAGIRAEMDARAETVDYRIREAEAKSIPYILIVGEREELLNSVSLRLRSGEQIGDQTIQGVIQIIRTAIEAKR